MKRNKISIRRGSISKSAVVSYLSPEEVQKLANGARIGKNRDRDYLFVLLLFQTGLRISEALSLTPAKINQFERKPVLDIIGKGNKLSMGMKKCTSFENEKCTTHHGAIRRAWWTRFPLLPWDMTVC